MIGYVMVGTNNLEKAVKFYDELLAELDIGRFMEGETFVAWGAADSPGFSVTKPIDGNPATVGNGSMVALIVENSGKVDAMYGKAIELGATDEGAPRPRGDGAFYAGYFRDLDGNKLNFFSVG